MDFRMLIKTPKTQLGFLLTLILLCAFVHNPSLQVIKLFFASVISCVFFDFLFLKIRRAQFFFPSADLVSALIITLLTAPNLPLYEPVVACLLAMFSKNFIKFFYPTKGGASKHVFNPAAFGLFFESVLFHHTISWWGVSWIEIVPKNIILIFLLLSPLYVSAIRMKRYWNQISFLMTPFFLTALFGIVQGGIKLLPFAGGLSLASILDPTVLFFTFVTLPEPMTTPVRPAQQFLFGTFVAIVSFILFLPIFSSQFSVLNSVDPLIFGLLAGNLLFFKFR